MKYKYISKDSSNIPTPETRTTFLDKITAYATFFATVISALALLVSIYTIKLASKQASEQSKQTSEQFQMQKQQHILDSVQRIRFLLREDSLSKLHDSMSSEQLRLLKIQSEIIANQQKDQQRGIQNEVLFRSPKFNVWFNSWTPDTSTTSQKIPFVVQNIGLVEALEDTIELFFYSESSRRCIHTIGFTGILTPNDTIQFPIKFTAKWYNTNFENLFPNSYRGLPCYLIARFNFKNPMMHARQNIFMGWKYEQHQSSIFRISLGPTEIDKVKKEIVELYSSDLDLEILKSNYLDSSFRKVNLKIKNNSTSILNDVRINLTVADGDFNVGFNNKEILMEKIKSSESFVTSINLPEKLSKCLIKDDGFFIQIEYSYKSLFDRETKHKRALFFFWTEKEKSQKIKLQYDSKPPLSFDYLLTFEQELDNCEIIW